MKPSRVKTIGVTEFKAKCLGLVDEVARGKTSKVILTRRGKAVAELREPSRDEPRKVPKLHGALKGMLALDPNFDLTTPTSTLIDWDLDSAKLYNE
jgi:antitoxin (DNA-binding transcriptional repressor) of toxin-antitoxin stability system